MTLIEFDKTIQTQNPNLTVVGIDEAGRGPLAGPVVAAACYIPCELYDNPIMQMVNDSKKLTPAKRDKLFKELTKLPITYCIGFASAQEIDNINILQATFLAMSRALAKFDSKSLIALVDGNHIIPLVKHRQQAIIGGDASSLAIAAASILAKVTRDRFMEIIDKQYPVYGFCGHKGYGAKTHIEAIQKNGPCQQHRKSFEPVKSMFYSLFTEEL